MRTFKWDINIYWFNWKYIITFINVVEKNTSQKFRLKNIDETGNKK